MPRSAAAVVHNPPPDPVEASFRVVPIDQVGESPLNPRKRYEARALEELVASIRLHGVIEPLVVRPNAFEGQAFEAFEIVAGSRRYRAAKLAGVAVLPVMVRDVTDAQLLELALEENVKRASMSALEEAQALEKLATLDTIYRDDKILAGRIGRSETYVRDRRKLLKLSPIVLEALEAEAITAKHAERIARLPVDIHELALAACFDALLVDVDDAAVRDLSNTRPETLITEKRWAALAPALIGLRRFDEWAEMHAKADITAPEVQQQLADVLHADDAFVSNRPDGLTEDEAVAAATTSFLQLSTEASTKDARALSVIPPSAYRIVAKAKDRCDYTRKGVVVHPPPAEGLGVELLDVCAERRRCAKHWPSATAGKSGAKGAAKPAGKPQWQIDQERREEERKAWDAVRDRYLAALAAHTAKTKLTPQLLIEVFGRDLGWLAEQYGVKVTPATVAQLLRLRSVRTNALEFFAQDAKKLGLDVRAITKAIAAEQKRAATPMTVKEVAARLPRAKAKKGAKKGGKR